jgi:hypothetical protein
MDDAWRARRVGTQEAAAYCRLSPRTLEKWRLLGGGPPFLKLGRRVLYDLRDLDHWLAECRRSSTSANGRGDAAPRHRDHEGSASERPPDRRTD